MESKPSRQYHVVPAASRARLSAFAILVEEIEHASLVEGVGPRLEADQALISCSLVP